MANRWGNSGNSERLYFFLGSWTAEQGKQKNALAALAPPASGSPTLRSGCVSQGWPLLPHTWGLSGSVTCSIRTSLHIQPKRRHFLFFFPFFFPKPALCLDGPAGERNKLKTNQVRCTILDAWGWCTGTTQRDGMGREEGSGWGTHVYLWQIHFDKW